MEQPDPLLRTRILRLIVVVYRRSYLAIVHPLLSGQGHEAARRELLDDRPKLREQSRVEIPRRVERFEIRGHDTPPVQLRVRLARPKESPHRLEHHYDLGNLFLHVLELGDAYSVRDERGYTEHELCLGNVLDYHLVTHVHDPTAYLLQSVCSLHILQQEHPLPRNQDVVKDHHRVLLVKP